MEFNNSLLIVTLPSGPSVIDCVVPSCSFFIKGKVGVSLGLSASLIAIGVDPLIISHLSKSSSGLKLKLPNSNFESSFMLHLKLLLHSLSFAKELVFIENGFLFSNENLLCSNALLNILDSLLLSEFLFHIENILWRGIGLEAQLVF
jgi:hypothetical protein